MQNVYELELTFVTLILMQFLKNWNKTYDSNFFAISNTVLNVAKQRYRSKSFITEQNIK